MASNKELFEILQSTATLQVERQSDAVNSIEAKIGMILSSIGVFLPLILAVITNSGQISWNLYLETGLFSFLCVIGVNIFTLWTKEFKISPDIDKFYHSFKGQTNMNITRETALKSMFLAIDENHKKIEIKGKLFNFSLIILGIGILAFVYGLFIQIPNQSNIMYNSVYAKSIQSK